MSSSSSEFEFLSLCQCPSRSSSLSPSSSIYPSSFSLVIKFSGGEEPELKGSVLKLFYCVWLAAGLANLNYRRSKLDFSEAPQPRKGEEPLSIFFLGFKGLATFKMWDCQNTYPVMFSFKESLLTLVLLYDPVRIVSGHQ